MLLYYDLKNMRWSSKVVLAKVKRNGDLYLLTDKIIGAESLVGKALAFHVANSGLVPGIPYDPSRLAGSDF